MTDDQIQYIEEKAREIGANSCTTRGNKVLVVFAEDHACEGEEERIEATSATVYLADPSDKRYLIGRVLAELQRNDCTEDEFLNLANAMIA